MARVPIEAGFFAIPDDPADPPHLLGSRCPACDEVFFPRRLVCAQCLHEGTDDVELSTRGRLWTWTVQRHAPKSPPYVAPASGFAPFAVGYVELPEGVRVAAVLDVPPDDVSIGMPLRIGPGPGVPRAVVDR